MYRCVCVCVCGVEMCACALTVLGAVAVVNIEVYNGDLLYGGRMLRESVHGSNGHIVEDTEAARL